tara:strand:+ start:9412 stop:9612 length:201 start_codon:yes stop_codon:yes gene_type:complete
MLVLKRKNLINCNLKQHRQSTYYNHGGDIIYIIGDVYWLESPTTTLGKVYASLFYGLFEKFVRKGI